jgi:uncharacterized membrane protein YGL010W
MQSFTFMLNTTHTLERPQQQYHPHLLQSPINCLCHQVASAYEQYSIYHTNIINKLIHFITIPIIIATTAHFLEKCHIVYDDEKLIHRRPKLNVNYSMNTLSIVQVAYCTYYFTWSWTIGIVMMFYFEAILHLLHHTQRYLMVRYNSRFTTDAIILLVWFTAWGMQFMGHYIEGNRPALTESISAAFLTAPMFSLDFLFNNI